MTVYSPLHTMIDVIPCGPGHRHMQWVCSCGAKGKQVPMFRRASQFASPGAKVLEAHREHVLLHEPVVRLMDEW